MPVLVQLADSVIANKFPLSDKTISIGRSSDNEVQIDDRAVSGHHAWIEAVKDEENEELIRYRLIDLNSTNGSFLNEKKVSEEWLRHNDMIRIGWVNFKFIDETQQIFEETTKVHKSWIPGVYYTK